VLANWEATHHTGLPNNQQNEVLGVSSDNPEIRRRGGSALKKKLFFGRELITGLWVLRISERLSTLKLRVSVGIVEAAQE
jgi:hypothetical protein